MTAVFQTFRSVRSGRTARAWSPTEKEDEGKKDADAPQGGVGKATLGGGSQMIVAVSGGGSLTGST